MFCKNKINYSLFFIIFLTSFLLGIIFSLQVLKVLNDNMLKNYYLWDKSEINIETKKLTNLDFSKYNQVFDLISENYFDKNMLDYNSMLEESIKWLVDWIGDKHSSYFNYEENEDFQESLSWDFEWIWAVVEMNNIWVLVDRIIKWSPAKNSDIRSWDVIISANWEKLEWLSLYEAVWKIKWKAWTVVVLEIIRQGENTIITKEVTRDKIKIPSVEFEEIDDKTWYISLNMFGENTFNEFLKALEELNDKDGIIIDLRDNWWWYLLSAVNILSSFIEWWETVVQTRYRDSKQNSDYISYENDIFYKWKIVILINENSASASEITAGALRDYNKAILVWKKSYGKWSVQHPFMLSDWSMVKLTIAKWFTPNWVNIDETWIQPDIEIDFIEEDYENRYDRQKEEAKKILNDFIKNDALNLTVDKYKTHRNKR